MFLTALLRTHVSQLLLGTTLFRSFFFVSSELRRQHELLCSRQSYFLNALCMILLILVTWKDLIRSHQFKGQSFRDLQLFYSHYSTFTFLIQVFLSISFSLISSTNTKHPLPSSSTEHTEKNDELSLHWDLPGN